MLARLVVKKAESGRWITIGGTKGKDGKRKGGSPVYIENGRITKGHPSLTGKKIGNLKEDAEDAPKKDRGRAATKREQTADKAAQSRRDNKSSQEYSQAVWRKKARKIGHDPKHLDTLAGELKAHHDAFANERKDVLAHARSLAKGDRFDSLVGLRGRSDRVEDADSIRGFDEVAASTAEAFPHHFRPEDRDHGSHGDQLYNMLTSGNDSLTWDDAYSQAFDAMGEPGKHDDPDPDDFAFGANVKAFRRPWVSKAFGRSFARFDPNKHKRGNAQNAGQFSAGGGGAKKPAAPVARHNPDLDAAFGEAPAKPKAPAANIRAHGPDIFAEHGEPARHPSIHNPAITYGHADDRDSDDAHFTRQMRATARGVRAAKRKLDAKLASDPTNTPAIRVLRAKLDQHTAKVEALKQRAGGAAKPAASAPPTDPKQARADRMGAAFNRIAGQRDRGKDPSGGEARPKPIPMERIGGSVGAQQAEGREWLNQTVGNRPPATPPPLPPGYRQPPAMPHQRTQVAALEHARNVRPGDHASHQRAVAALDAHYKEGLAALKRMAGSRAGGKAHRAAAEQFRAKIGAARGKIDQIAGKGPPPVPRQAGAKGPPPLADRGKVRPWVSMKAFDLDLSLPMVRKSHDVSGEARDEGGRWTAGGSSTHDRLKAAIAHVSERGAGDISHHRTLADDAVGELGKLPQADIYKHLHEAGLEGIKPRDSRKAMLRRLHNRLTAALRAVERNDRGWTFDKSAQHPWLVKMRDSSGHEHASDGRFGNGGSHAPKPAPATRKPTGYDRKPSKDAGHTAKAESKAKTLAARISEVPAQLRHQVTSFVRGRYRRLAKRYGPKGAYAIIGAAILLLPVPVPGSSLIPIAVAETILALKRAVTKGHEADLSPEQIKTEARKLVRELYAACGEEMPK